MASYWFTARPENVEHQHPYLVFDCQDCLHLPLTHFAKVACSRLDPKTVPIYLYALCPYFTWLSTNRWQVREAQTWDAPPTQVQRSIDDYLIQKLWCQILPQRQGWKYVKITTGTKSTLRIFLAALKLFYQVMREREMYSFANPLVDGTNATITAAIDHLEKAEDEQVTPRMPAQSGVQTPATKPNHRLTDSYYKLEHEEWKTQIAVEFAYQHRQEYQHVLWVLADTRESLVSGYIVIAQLLGMSEKNQQDQAVIVQAVKSWLQTHGSWLLILDNADELAMAYEFLPPTFEGHLLMTTRARATGTPAHRIEVEVMPEDVGALFLLHRAKLVALEVELVGVSEAFATIAKEICKELGGLPLALDQAGAYIEEVECSLQDYQQRYRNRRASLLKRRGEMVKDHPDSVAATWSLSFEKVEQRSPAAADLLRVCAHLSPDAIPEEIVKQGAGHLGPSLAQVAQDDVAFDEAVAALLAHLG